MFKEKARGGSEDMFLEEILAPADVLLVVSPLMEINIPSLGLHLIQASCLDKGVDTRVLYSNLHFSKIVGLDLHKTISRDNYLLLGERLFATAAFNLPSVSIGRVKQKFSNSDWWPDHLWQVKGNTEDPQVPIPVVPFREWVGTVDLEYLESSTYNWLHALACQIVNIGSRIVGCSTTLGGLVPAIALLNCVKKANPDVITIIGGALCEADLAEGILSLNTGIDYIFSGEGEITFPALVKQILKGYLPKEKIICGEYVNDLDTIPLPDYHDYMVQRKNNFALPFETSRGCRFGKCTFCGLNGRRNLVRSKSPDAIIQSIKTLVDRHHMNSIYMCDTMMPSQYFDILLPRLSTELPSIKIFYEIKANLTLTQVLSLKKAGITELQPGIESLSSSLLKRMHKPNTVFENIALLRYSRSVGINLRWNLLFGFPGDQTCEYEEMLHLLPLIRHLQPPASMFPLILNRFSKYQMSPEVFGISNLRPAEFHKDTLPSHADLDKIAYFFTGDFQAHSHENPSIIMELWEEFNAWRSAWSAYETIPLDILLPALHVTRKTFDWYVLEDTRGLPGRPKRIEINRKQASLLLLTRPLEAAPDDDVRWAVDAGLGVVMESWFIPLATAEPGLLQEFEYDSKHLQLSGKK